MLHLSRHGTGYIDALWTPAQMGMAAWYDAADGATLILSAGGQVDQWSDKSGNGRHLTQSGSLARPGYDPNGATGSLPAVVWQSGSYNEALRCGSPFLWQYAVSVARYGDGVQATWLTSFAGMFGTDGTFGCIGNTAGTASFVGSLTNRLRMDGGPEDADGHIDPALPWPTRILAARINAGPTSDNFVLGNDRSTTGRGWTGPISEVLVFPSTPSDANRERLEGYLAHKWGTVGSLPVGHAYRTSPPLA